MLAWYLRKEGFFTRLDWYFSGRNNDRIRPDLAVLLPTSKCLLYLELKRVGGGYPYTNLWKDIYKLEKISTEGQPDGNKENQRNWLLVFGFDEHGELMGRLEGKLKKLIKEYPKYQLYDIQKLKLADMTRSEVPTKSV